MRLRLLCILGLAALLPAVAFADIRADELAWRVGDDQFSGYLVYDDVGPARPGLVMVPNWMGVNASAVEKAKAVAAEGYVVLVADVYGKDLRPANAQEAGKAAGAQYADRPRLRQRLVAAVELLKAQSATLPVDASRIAAFGFCFGGASVLELARSGYDIAAAISFHGGLATSLPAAAGAVKAQLLVLNGAADSYVKAEEIAAFESEMRAAGADWQFVNFADAVHCFAEADANSPPGCVYHERSARRAYRMMYAQLDEAFGQR